MQPEWMSRLSPAIFTTWSMRGLNDLILRQRGLESVMLPSGVLALYGVVILAVGLQLFRVRHSAR